MADIPIVKAGPKKLKKKPDPGAQLGFGKIFSDYLFLMDYKKGEGWKNPRIEPYKPFALDPAALVLHYGQEVFEGLKAYRWANGDIYLFRPRMNYERMNRSAKRLCLPEMDVNFAIEATRQLVRLEKDWVPSASGSSLYIRPNMIATEPALGVQVAKEVLFYIMVGPVGAYYPQGFNPVDIYLEEKYIRAAAGGWVKPRPWPITPPACWPRKRPMRKALPRSCGSTPSNGNTWKKSEQATSFCTSAMKWSPLPSGGRSSPG